MPVRPRRTAPGRRARTLQGLASRFLVEALEGRQLMANAVTQLAIAPVASASSLAAGTPAQYTITAEDAGGALVGDFAGTVQFSSSDPDAVTPYEATLSGGTATVSVTFTSAGQQTFTVHEKDHDDVTGASAGVVVTPLAAVTLAVSAPTNPQAGAATTLAVTALDTYGNTVTGDSDQVTLTTTDAAATLPATVALVDGVATVPVTFATPGVQSVAAADAAGGVAGASAAVAVGQIVQGVVYLDPSAGPYSADAPGISGRVVYLDLNDDGKLDAGDPTATTDAQGHFAFPGYAAGAAVVREDLSQDPTYRNAIASTTFAADGSLTIGVTPGSAVVPLPMGMDPFAATTVTGTGATYVQSLYRSVLGRDGADAEVASWVAAMQDGMTLAQVAAGFVDSTEHHQDEVDAYYAHFLGRTPDALGNAVWVGDLDSGSLDETGVTEAILGSTEYRVAHPVASSDSLDNPFVRSLYLTVLGRSPDPDGFTAWSAAMHDGTSAADVVAGFVRSAEATDAAVASFYPALFRSAPDGSMTNWTNLLRQQGGTPSAVLRNMLGGATYAGLVAAIPSGVAPATANAFDGTWYAANLQTPQIAGLVEADVLDHGQLTRADMIALMGAVISNGDLTAGEFADLQTIVDDTSVVAMSPSVRSLSQKFVDGSKANKLYQGAALGDLAVGSTPAQMQDLVNKWYLGLDHPEVDPGEGLTYGTPGGTLYGTAGQPGYRQVQQGAAGDCYFMSSLGSMALHSAESFITNMIVPNGDGTYTVRFFDVVAGVATADYVTVDGELPESGGDYYYGNAYGPFDATDVATWVPLVEKAYAQWSSEGFNDALSSSERDNSYVGIGDGSSKANDMIEALTGDLGYKVVGAYGSALTLPNDQLASIAAAFADGSSVIFSTLEDDINDGGSEPAPTNAKLVSGHDYALVAIDVEDQTFTLFNPWGLAGATEGGVDKPGLVTIDWADAGANFDMFADKKAPTV